MSPAGGRTNATATSHQSQTAACAAPPGRRTEALAAEHVAARWSLHRTTVAVQLRQADQLARRGGLFPGVPQILGEWAGEPKLACAAIISEVQRSAA